jgi:hypothetical protein
MAVGWYIIPYIRDRREDSPPRCRRVAIDQYTAQILAAGGYWSETEVLDPGIGRAIVKVRASTAVLTQLDGLYKRLPKDRLDDPLSDLPTAVLTTIRDELLDMGYPLAEIRDRFGLTVDDLANYTLRDVLRFAARRRRKVRYDTGTDSLICDGVIQTPKSIETVDAEVAED